MSDKPKHRRVPISVREWLVAGFASLTLAFSAWGFGGVISWSLHTLFIGGLLTFLVAICPSVSRQGRGYPSFRFPGNAYKRLVCWPFFWLALCFLVYLTLGALNPAIEIVRDERGWWVEAMTPALATWLPISVESSYEPMNAWRVIVGFAGSFSLAWGVWAGINRRPAILLVLWSLLLSGAAMALAAILQDMTDADKVLWSIASSNRQFWGSFFYRNQGAAYLNLVMVTAGVLYFYHAYKCRERAKSGGPHFLCFLLFALIASSVSLALSRGGILFASVITVGFVILVVVYALSGFRQISSMRVTLISVIPLLCGSLFFAGYIDMKAVEERFGDLEKSIEGISQENRYFSSQATWDMAQARLWLGWGAGAFRYVFPMYQRDYPELYYKRYHKVKQQWIGRRLYRYAHNDILQFIAEYGVVGSILVFGALLSLLAMALYYACSSSIFVGLMLFVGMSQAFGHAFLDFIFNSPAYWMAFVGLLASSAKLLRLESDRRVSRGSS